MEEKVFVAEDIEFSFLVRVHDFFAAIFRRKDTLKTFCRDLKIDYPIPTNFNPNSKAFPDKYLIRADEIEYLGKNRDKITLAVYESYKQCQEKTTSDLVNEKKNLETETSVLAQEKERTTDLRKRLKDAKSALEKLTLDADIVESETRVKNTRLNITSIETEIEKDQLLLVENQKSWKNQVSQIDAAFDTQAKKYTLSATKKIRKKLNYTKFHHQIPEKSDDVKEIS